MKNFSKILKVGPNLGWIGLEPLIGKFKQEISSEMLKKQNQQHWNHTLRIDVYGFCLIFWKKCVQIDRPKWKGSSNKERYNMKLTLVK